MILISGSTRIVLLGLGCCLLLFAPILHDSGARAAEFRIISADTYLEQGVYRLNARVEYGLNQGQLKALQNGVPLTILLEMEVLRRRTWLWDETVANLQQLYKLEYHALARQYVVTNLNSGELISFPTWSAATQFIGRIDDFPLLDSSLLDSEEHYYVRLRARLDIESLPAPLRPLAYLSGEWRLTSEWYTWPL